MYRTILQYKEGGFMKKVFMLGLFLSMTLAVISPIRFANAMVDADYDDEAVAKKGMSTGTVESGTYFENMGRNFKRGFTNILSSPLEIPIPLNNIIMKRKWLLSSGRLSDSLTAHFKWGFVWAAVRMMFSWPSSRGSKMWLRLNRALYSRVMHGR